MKLKNKITGEIIDLDIADVKARFGVISVIPEPAVLGSPEYVYTSLDELTAEWEDYKERKAGYIIDPLDEDGYSRDDDCFEEGDRQRAKELGIWFETKEEVEKVVEKLKARKRLKDKGFRFVGWKNGKLEYPDYVSFDCEDYKGCAKDLDIVFGGEE